MDTESGSAAQDDPVCPLTRPAHMCRTGMLGCQVISTILDLLITSEFPHRSIPPSSIPAHPIQGHGGLESIPKAMGARQGTRQDREPTQPVTPTGNWANCSINLGVFLD